MIMIFLPVCSSDICLIVQWTEDIIHINILTSVELVGTNDLDFLFYMDLLVTDYMRQHMRLNRGSYISAPIILNLLNELGGKEIKCQAC